MGGVTTRPATCESGSMTVGQRRSAASGAKRGSDADASASDTTSPAAAAPARTAPSFGRPGA